MRDRYCFPTSLPYVDNIFAVTLFVKNRWFTATILKKEGLTYFLKMKNKGRKEIKIKQNKIAQK